MRLVRVLFAQLKSQGGYRDELADTLERHCEQIPEDVVERYYYHTKVRLVRVKHAVEKSQDVAIAIDLWVSARQMFEKINTATQVSFLGSAPKKCAHLRVALLSMPEAIIGNMSCKQDCRRINSMVPYFEECGLLEYFCKLTPWANLAEQLMGLSLFVLSEENRRVAHEAALSWIYALDNSVFDGWFPLSPHFCFCLLQLTRFCFCFSFHCSVVIDLLQRGRLFG